MRIEKLTRIIGADFYTGVPDSQLKAMCNYLNNTYGIDPKHHVIAANEGNCAALATGYHLATGKVPVIYMQNSGEGNIINPVASLLNDQVYAIPAVFIVGWRGEPGVRDEPQHIYQGEVTLKLLEVMGIRAFVIRPDTSDEEVEEAMRGFRGDLAKGKDVAFVVCKGALTYDEKTKYGNDNVMLREEVIRHIVAVSGNDVVVCTTGKASRELFEVREALGQGHGHDFLTVGSMGHSSSIALGIAIHKPDKRVWCIDGDGAMLMHMGAMAVIGANAPKNMVHILINNESHETVGGMPTVIRSVDVIRLAEACGYPKAVCVRSYAELDRELENAAQGGELTLIEARCSIGARSDLGRPTTTPLDNKLSFMKTLST